VPISRFSIAVFAALFIFTAPLVRAESSLPAKLTPQAVADIERIEIYLTNLETLKAGFLQVSSTGEIATGQFFLSRPGHLRFEYDPPSPILMIADGIFLIYIDKDLEQVTHILQNNTPVGVLTREDVLLSGDITVIGFARGRGAIRVSLAQTDNPEKGAITLIFSDKPLQLRKWVVIDPQGTRTTITLSNMKLGVKLDPKMFVFQGLKESQ